MYDTSQKWYLNSWWKGAVEEGKTFGSWKSRPYPAAQTGASKLRTTAGIKHLCLKILSSEMKQAKSGLIW